MSCVTRLLDPGKTLINRLDCKPSTLFTCTSYCIYTHKQLPLFKGTRPNNLMGKTKSPFYIPDKSVHVHTSQNFSKILKLWYRAIRARALSTDLKILNFHKKYLVQLKGSFVFFHYLLSLKATATVGEVMEFSSK